MTDLSTGGLNRLNLSRIRKLIAMLEASTLAEIEIQAGEESIRLSKHSTAAPTPAGLTSITVAPAAQAGSAPLLGPQATTPIDVATNGVVLRAPMVGTFYARPNPDAPPFVRPGDTVRKGQTLAIIEAMKMFNPIECEIDGVVLGILVEDGQPVEYDQAMIAIDPAR